MPGTMLAGRGPGLEPSWQRDHPVPRPPGCPPEPGLR